MFRPAICETGISAGTLDIVGASTMYLAGTNNGTAEGSKLTLNHNVGLTIISSCEEDWKPDSIAQFQLLGRTLSFTVDLSEVGCACNLAFYLIAAPGRGIDGEPNRGNHREGAPPFYCDANKVGGQWCPEIDLMEANNHVFQATPHRCEPSVEGHYELCDRGGCAQNTRDVEASYGPGDNYTIDTRYPFQVHSIFLEDDGVLTGIRTVLQQDPRRVVFEHSECGATYLASLSDAVRAGMSLRITYWGDEAKTMAWLDAPPCAGETCSGTNAGDAVISDITVSDKLWENYRAEVVPPEGAPQQRPGMETAPMALGPLPIFEEEKEPESDELIFQADPWAPWECHHFTTEQFRQPDWCSTVGFFENYNFEYNGGHDRKCGTCWCCKQRGKLVGPPTTSRTQTSTTTTTPKPKHAELVWVVSDRNDARLGSIVPKALTDDPINFVSFEDHGVVVWDQQGSPVERMHGYDVKKFIRKCGDTDQNPCEVSLAKEHGYFSAMMKKYTDSVAHDFSGGAARLTSAQAFAVALTMAVLAAASITTLFVRRRLRHGPGRPGASGAAGLLGEGGAAAGETQRSSTAAFARCRSPSTQRLLDLLEGTGSSDV